MIRIDLGRDDLDKGKEPKAETTFFGLKLPSGPKKPNVSMDIGSVLLLTVAAAFAFLPYLFVDQYRSFVNGQHQAVMKKMQEEENALKDEIAKYNGFQAELKSYQDQKKMISDRLAAVRQLLQNRNTPVNVLDAVGQSIPARTWLSSIDLSVEGKPQLALQGSAYSNEDVSDFVEKLSESIYLSDVTLDEVTGASSGDVVTKGFGIHAVPKGVQPMMNERDTAALPGAQPVAQAVGAPPSSTVPTAPAAAPMPVPLPQQVGAPAAPQNNPGVPGQGPANP